MCRRNVEVTCINAQNDLPIDENSISQTVNLVVQNEERRYDEVTIHFVSVDEICKLHEEYFDDPSPTDCISFPIDLEDEDDEEDEDDYKVMGDVFVCPQVAIEYAIANNGNPYWETTLYVVHGLLHLMGYDDIDELDEKKMRAAESRHMKLLIDQGAIIKSTQATKEH